MRLFALCCKSDQEYQAMDVCSMMPTSASMSLAIKYASRIRKIMLAQRLSEICQEKVQEEQEAILKKQQKMDVESEEEDDDFRTELQAGYSAAETEWSTQRSSNKPSSSQPGGLDEDDDDVMVTSQPTEVRRESEVSKEKMKPARSLSSQLAGSRRNPFKKSALPVTPTTTPEATSSGSVLDGIKRATPTNQRKKQSITPEIGKKLKSKDSTKKKGGAQATLFTTKLNLTSTPKPKKVLQRSKPDVDDEVLQKSAEDNVDVPSKATTGVQLYLDEHLPHLEEEHPDLDAIDVRKMGIKNFRAISVEEKKNWNNRAKSASMRSAAGTAGGNKRKLADEVDENDPPCSGDVITSSNPAKNLRLDMDEAADADTCNAKAKLSSFAYSATE
uniref:WD repeat and HMG-box DNA-binding protein 1 n=1 Tax=Ciona savignyi TaxID=51511 RepID=H2YB76_CIOSA